MCSFQKAGGEGEAEVWVGQMTGSTKEERRHAAGCLAVLHRAVREDFHGDLAGRVSRVDGTVNRRRRPTEHVRRDTGDEAQRKDFHEWMAMSDRL
jgi:hypothetical protein